MNTADKKTFETHYQQLLKCLKLQGKADKTIASYSRALRRLNQYFDGLPETIQQAKNHMARGGAQSAMKAVVKDCGIKKKSPSNKDRS